MLLRLVVSRCAFAALTLVAVSFLIFVGTQLLPGDVAQAILGQTATPETVAAIRRELNLDRPAHERYLDWIFDCLRGDLGRSLASGAPIADLIGGRLNNTLVLALTSALVAMPLSIALGLYAALRREQVADHAISAITLIFVSVPEFLIAYILMMALAVKLAWLPALSMLNDGASLWAWMRALALPVLTLTLVTLAHTMRLTRTAIVSILSTDYIRMAELKGISPARIILRHALPNAMSPILSILMLTLAYLVVGVVVVETVFSYSGMGKLMVDAVTARDIPLVQACGLIFTTVYVVCNFLADLLGLLVNPRLRHPK